MRHSRVYWELTLKTEEFGLLIQKSGPLSLPCVSPTIYHDPRQTSRFFRVTSGRLFLALFIFVGDLGVFGSQRLTGES